MCKEAHWLNKRWFWIGGGDAPAIGLSTLLISHNLLSPDMDTQTSRYPTLKSRIFPNGDFTVGYSKPKSRRDGKVRLSDAHYEQCLVEQDDHIYGRMEETIAERHVANTYQPPIREKIVRARKGLKGIGGEAKRKLRSGCYLLAERYGNKRLGFLTLTLPNADWLTDIWALNFSELVRQVIQEIRRELQRKGAPDSVVGAIELQTERFEEYGQVAPHLHLVYVARANPRKPSWYISAKTFRKIWKRVLIAVVRPECPNIDELKKHIEWDAAVDCAMIRKSAESYLSKYLSKGGGDIEAILEEYGEEFVPKAWYTISSKLLKAIMSSILSLSDRYLEILIGCMDAKEVQDLSDGIIAWMHKFEIPINPEISLTGYVGRLKIRDYLEVCLDLS